ncbi:MAG: hypothetical protein S4CHLAM45_14040 [Chlamydiales bacterium]|nr:hypothetical protein [Chlamydiales bacterium]MCH9620509.1 hypothetical protein [Chlamydiales bacterium]MCH9623494.1 hypothetical protein [Chlamydiales bacterium]
MTALLLLLVIGFVLLSGFLSFSQVALFSLSSTDLQTYAQDKQKKTATNLLKRPRDLLVTLLFCDVCANILLQNTAANLFGETSSWLMKVGIPLVLTLFIGEILPKTFALPYNKHIAYRVAPMILFLQRLLGPIRSFITAVTTSISRNLFFFLKPNKEISKEEMGYLLKNSEEMGILDPNEARWVQGYLSLIGQTTKERMHPRDEIFFYNLDAPLTQLIEKFGKRAYARIPVCKGELQNMVGILFSIDFFIHRHKIQTGMDLIPFLRKPFYVPEATPLHALSHRFLEQNETMALAVDEYGLISGLITDEDIFELVVGKFFQTEEKNRRYTQPSENVLIASGKLELCEFTSLFNKSLPTKNKMVTLGGWLTERLGEIPKSGTTYTWENFLFQILSSEPHRIKRIYVRRLK